MAPAGRNAGNMTSRVCVVFLTHNVMITQATQEVGNATFYKLVGDFPASIHDEFVRSNFCTSSDLSFDAIYANRSESPGTNSHNETLDNNNQA